MMSVDSFPTPLHLISYSYFGPSGGGNDANFWFHCLNSQSLTTGEKEEEDLTLADLFDSLRVIRLLT